MSHADHGSTGRPGAPSPLYAAAGSGACLVVAALCAWVFRFHYSEVVLALAAPLTAAVLWPRLGHRPAELRRLWRRHVLPRGLVLLAAGAVYLGILDYRQHFGRLTVEGTLAWYWLAGGLVTLLALAACAVQSLVLRLTRPGGARVAGMAVAGVVLLGLLGPPSFAALHAHRPKLSYSTTPADYDLPYRDLDLTAADGTYISAWYVPGDPGRPALVVSHGVGANRGDCMVHARFLWGPEGARRHLVFLDLRGHGLSGGHSVTFGRDEAQDFSACVDWLADRSGCDRSRIGAYGFSMGAATAIQAAARDPRIAFVVADAGFTSIGDMVGHQLAVLGPLEAGAAALVHASGSLLLGQDLAVLSPLAALDRMRATPVLFIHGTADGVIPYEQSLRMYQRKVDLEAPLVRSELYIHEGGHPTQYGMDLADYHRRVETFLGRGVRVEREE